MQVVKHTEGERCEPTPGWRRVHLAGSENISVEYFEKPAGHTSPLHSHVQEQTCIVIRGRMRAIGANGEKVELAAGDSVWFAPSEPHAIENAGDDTAVGVDVFVPARSFSFWLKKSESGV